MRHFTILVLEGNAGNAEVVTGLLRKAFPRSTVFHLPRAALQAQLGNSVSRQQTWDLVVDLAVLGDDYRGEACGELAEMMPSATVVHLCVSQTRDHQAVVSHFRDCHRDPHTLPAIVVIHHDEGWERELLHKAKTALMVRTARAKIQRLLPDLPP